MRPPFGSPETALESGLFFDRGKDFCEVTKVLAPIVSVTQIMTQASSIWRRDRGSISRLVIELVHEELEQGWADKDTVILMIKR
jgi:hypothetical protein